VKGGGVVSGRGVVLTLLAVEEDLRGTVDVVVTGSKVEQRSLAFPFSDVLEHFRKISQEVPPRNLKVEFNQIKLNSLKINN